MGVLRVLTVACLAVLGLTAGSAAQDRPPSPVPRPTPVAGAVVSTKGGEELQFARERAWRGVDLWQDLIGGDQLRTNAIGTLGILFADQTLIRMGRQSTLIVNGVATGDKPTELTLPTGTVWARAARGGTSVTVKTPAATAAIRGTDWSLSVEGSRTSLIVLEGEVEFSNPQGSVTVRQGEGATAAIGQRPTKIVIVRTQDREQMLYYLSLRGGLTQLPATDRDGSAVPGLRDRIRAIPPQRRSPEDWLSLAEVSLPLDGRDAARSALAEARRARLGGRLAARADLVEALLASAERRYAEAARLFQRAEPSLDARRRISARYGAYLAASLADPKRVIAPPAPTGSDPREAMAQAYVTGFARDLPSAADALDAAAKRHPHDAGLAVMQAQAGLLLARRDTVRAAVARAKALDPDSPETLLAEAYLKSDVESDLIGAEALLDRAIAIAPGQSDLWNVLGLVRSGRDLTLAAEDAFQRAIAADPDDPVAYANYAILLLDQSRIAEAEALIEKALALDPNFSVGYVAKGRLLLQRGDMRKGLDYLLAGVAGNPAYAQGLLATAIAYYQAGDLELAEQALDNANRLDPNDPVTAIARTAISIDMMRADEAIESAREAVRRYRNRGGYFAPLAMTRQGGSYLAQAYRLLGLNEWARFYGDRVFDPFQASGYFDQAGAARFNPLYSPSRPDTVGANDVQISTFNLIVQGLLLDPLAVSGRAGRIDLLRRPFLDVDVGGGLVRRRGKTGWASDVTVQGFSNLPFPLSVSLSAGTIDTADRLRKGGEMTDRASAFVGATPTAQDRVLAWAVGEFSRPDLFPRADITFARDRQAVASGQAGGGWSHSFSDRNILSVAGVVAHGDDVRQQRQIIGTQLDLFGFPLPAVLDLAARRRAVLDTAVGAVGHTLGLDPTLTLKTGIEAVSARVAQRDEALQALTVARLGTQSDSSDQRQQAKSTGGRIYGDLFWQPTDWFQAQGGLQGQRYDPDGGRERSLVAPRLGIAVAPLENHWIRAAWRRDLDLPGAFTLSPVTTVGIVPHLLPTTLASRTDTKALRWDAEWTRFFFTSMEYQRQHVRDISLPLPQSFDTLALPGGRIDILSASANVWLTQGIGLFGTVGTARSRTEGQGADRLDIPFVPERFARFGLTFVHPSRIKFTLVQNLIGERRGDLSLTKLPAFATTDALVTWETPDRHLQVGLAVTNLLDRRYLLSPAAAGTNGDPNTLAVAGPGRTVSATVRARF